jgi:opacity protein-like surface antigen
MSLKKALLAATVLALPMAAAQAQPVSGLYLGAGAGLNFRHDTESRGIEVQTRVGGVGVGSIGWGFGNGIRAEIEGNYRENEIDKLTVQGGTWRPRRPSRARATSAPTA